MTNHFTRNQHNYFANKQLRAQPIQAPSHKINHAADQHGAGGGHAVMLAFLLLAMLVLTGCNRTGTAETLARSGQVSGGALVRAPSEQNAEQFYGQPVRPAQSAQSAQPATATTSGNNNVIVAAGDPTVAPAEPSQTKGYFDFDSSDLRPETQELLQQYTDWMLANPRAKLKIEGHADERGTREYNLALGARRASAAKRFIVAGGVASNRINTISYGKERPDDPRSNEVAWQKNRRFVALEIQK